MIFLADRRSFARVWNRLFIVALVVALTVSGASAEKRRALEELTNFALGAEYSQWLVGPVSRIAKSTEIDRFLSLTDDREAVEFIDDFWDKRADPSVPWPDKQPRAVFETRVDEADRKFTEGVTRGRRTDRGEIHIVYGPPPEIDYEDDPDSRQGPIEVWRYGKKTEPGLDGEKPKKLYRFVKSGQLTEFYAPSPKLRTSPSQRR